MPKHTYPDVEWSSVWQWVGDYEADGWWVELRVRQGASAREGCVEARVFVADATHLGPWKTAREPFPYKAGTSPAGAAFRALVGLWDAVTGTDPREVKKLLEWNEAARSFGTGAGPKR